MKAKQVKKFFSVFVLVLTFVFAQQAHAQSTTTVAADDDFGDSCATASAVTLNTTVDVAIHSPGDYDYFMIPVPSSGTLTVYSTGATDTFGYFKDSGCNDIVTDDNSSGGMNFYIERKVLAGTYYVAVRHADSISTGAYGLAINFTPMNAISNIMLVLDSSGSMTFPAYPDPCNPETNDLAGDVTGAVYQGGGCRAIATPMISTDDAAERSTKAGTATSGAIGTMSTTTNPLYMGNDGATTAGEWIVGLRFANVVVPKTVNGVPVTISKAYIRFTAQSASPAGNVASFTIAGQNAANPTTFTSTASNITSPSSRTWLGTTVTWNASSTDSPLTAWEVNKKYDTTDLKDIVSLMVTNASWASGNAMVFKITGDAGSKRWPYSYNGNAAYAPRLVIEYEPCEPKEYYGYFVPTARYVYNSTKQYFERTTSTGITTWSGNFLNWLCMRRFDVLKKVLIGGRRNVEGVTGGPAADNNTLVAEGLISAGQTNNWYWQTYYLDSHPATPTQVSPYTEAWYGVKGGSLYVNSTTPISSTTGNNPWTSPTATYKIAVKRDQALEPDDYCQDDSGVWNLCGVMQKIGSQAQWGNLWYFTSDTSSTQSTLVTNAIGTAIPIIVRDIEKRTANGATPTSNAIDKVTTYFKGGTTKGDPFKDKYGNISPSAKSYLLLLTDGEANVEGGYTFKDYDGDGNDALTGSARQYDDMDDLAFYAHTTDLRSDLGGTQTMETYVGYAFGKSMYAPTHLKETAINGGFKDRNGNGKADGYGPNASGANSGFTAYSSDQRVEWDKDGDGLPDNYIESQDGGTIAAQLRESITKMVAAYETDCADGIDNDGDGLTDCNDPDCQVFDNDNDGYTVCAGDCNDTNAAVHPGVAELCNDIDDNCNGQVDESACSTTTTANPTTTTMPPATSSTTTTTTMPPATSSTTTTTTMPPTTSSTTTTTIMKGTWGDFTYTDSGDTIAITDYSGLGGAVVIPDTINGKPVITIEYAAFRNCTGLTGLTIPGSVTGINLNTFSGCTGLTSINVDQSNPNYSSQDGVLYNKPRTTILQYPAGRVGEFIIPGSVTGTYGSAFYGCSGLTSVTIPSNDIFRFDAFPNPFSGCTGLTRFNVDENNPTYSSLDGVLYDKNKTAVECYPAGRTGGYIIPVGVSYIYSSAFTGCAGLTSIDVEAGNTSFSSQDGVLYNKDKTILKLYPAGRVGGFIIPSSVTDLAYHVFSGCAGLTSIETDQNNTTYSSLDGVLYNKDTTTLLIYPPGKPGEFIIPGSVTVINYEAFYGCIGLTSINIPGSVWYIDSDAFWGCTSLASINVDAGNPSYSSQDGIVYNKTKTNLYVYPPGRSGEFSIPASVTSIRSYAFSGCTGLTSVTVPASVTSIGSAVFNDCTGLISINIDPNNTTYSSQDGVVYNKTGTILVLYPVGRPDVFYIPAGVTSLGSSAFHGCTGLTSMTIPASVTSIGYYGFENCTGLTSVSIPNSVTSIGDYTFNGCTGLTSVTIPSSITSIGTRAFSDSTGLASISIPKSVMSIGVSAFWNCTGLTSLTLMNGVTSIGNAAFADCRGLTNVTIPGSVTSIGQWAFEWCNGLNSVTIMNGVTSIGGGAFDGCIGLITVTIPASVTNILFNPFRFCTGLTSFDVDASNSAYCSLDGVVYNKTMTTIVLYPPGKAGTFVIPDSVTVISSNAFTSAAGLTSVTLPNSLTTMGICAFCSCTGLTSVSIPSNVTSIEESGFRECSSLSAVYFYGNAPGMGSDVFGDSASGFTVYYLAGATGFTNPWYGYPTALFTPPTTTTTTVPVADTDGDGIGDSVDNCPNAYNPQQLDADSDGTGDVCDSTPGCGGCGQSACEQYVDSDNDGVPDVIDNCPTTCNAQQLDADNDGVGDVCDTSSGCGGCGQVACEVQCSL